MSPQDDIRILTFILLRQVSEYLNFSEWFMKNVLFEETKIKLWKKCHFVENKTEIMQHVLKMQYTSFLPEYKNESLGVFSYMHLHWAMQAFKQLQGM